MLGLLDPCAEITYDYFNFENQMISHGHNEIVRQGSAIIFQDPTTSLNPAKTIGSQLNETLYLHHRHASKDYLKQQVLELLNDVGLSSADTILKLYPHQFAGGVLQRIMIALALACSPRLLIADEATTNLDMTIQSQILELLTKLSKERKMAVLTITHDFSILAETTDTTSVMYCGYILETGSTRELLNHPKHPYTKALVNSIPQMGLAKKSRSHLYTLPGSIPPADNIPVGCPLGPRCPRAGKKCVKLPPYQEQDGHQFRCHFPIEFTLWENEV